MLELSARSNDWAAGPWWVSVPDEVDAVASAVPPASRVNAAAVRTSLADRPKLRCDDALGRYRTWSTSEGGTTSRLRQSGGQRSVAGQATPDVSSPISPRGQTSRERERARIR